MAFTEISSLDADVTVALGKKDKNGKPYPKQAEGYYLGTRTVQNKRGESRLHFLQTAKGNLGVWGTTDLDRKLGSVTPGSMVRVTSTGTKPTPNGDMYTYKVEVDADNKIDVASATTDNNEESYSANGGDGDLDETPVDEDFQAELAAQRKAKVQELLKNKR